MADQLGAVFKRQELEQEEPEESGVKLNDLPELPFELILSYLSLEDRIKSRAVSRRWYYVINRFRPIRSLCYSGRPSDFIYGKSRWVIGEFAQNFISSTKFGPFFQTFDQSILANLKHLRLCKLDLNAENPPASFVQILNSFGHLEELDLYEIDCPSEPSRSQLRLNLLMLKSIQLVNVLGIKKLTLDAPRLQNVKHFNSTKMELVHNESVEKLVIEELDDMEVKKMENLKYLYCGGTAIIDSTLLSTLEHLNEIHLHSEEDVSTLFEQKERYGRSNLKIFLLGFHLNASDDPAIESIDCENRGYLRYLIENPSKVAEEIPLCEHLLYSAIKAVAPGLENDLLKRFTDLKCINVFYLVQDVDRFLELLKNFNNIVELHFEAAEQQQELFDRLPDYHCAIQLLKLEKEPADWNFLFRLKSLISLHLWFPVGWLDIEIVPRVFEKLPFLSFFEFKYLNKEFEIRVDHLKQFTVWLRWKGETKVSDVNAVVQWICEKATENEESDDEE